MTEDVVKRLAKRLRSSRKSKDLLGNFFTACPPASGKAVAATETRLGFTLPRTLRQVYLEVANGGFGSVTGLTARIYGVRSGTPPPERLPGHERKLQYPREETMKEFTAVFTCVRRQTRKEDSPLKTQNNKKHRSQRAFCGFGYFVSL